MINDIPNFINSIQNETNQVILLIDVNESTHSKSSKSNGIYYVNIPIDKTIHGTRFQKTDQLNIEN